MGNLRNRLFAGLLVIVHGIGSGVQASMRAFFAFALAVAGFVASSSAMADYTAHYYYRVQSGASIFERTQATPAPNTQPSQCTYFGGTWWNNSCYGVVATSGGGTVYHSVVIPAQRVCPYGGTVSNGMCINLPACPTGQERNGSGQCVDVPCPIGYEKNSSGQCVKDCTGKMGQPTLSQNYSFEGAPANWSVGGCKVGCAVKVLAAEGGSGSECKFTGASADPDNPEAEALPPDPEKLPPEDEKDCTSQGMGYIQGSNGITCVPASDAPAGQKPESVEQDHGAKESGTPGVDGKPDPNASDYSKEEKSTSTSGGKTTETIKTTKNGTPDGNGGIQCPDGFTQVGTTSMCQKITSTTTSDKSFCEQNPTAAACKGESKSKFGGNCEGGFTCTGDEATCAAAKASYELKCSFEKGDATSDAGKGLIDGNDPQAGAIEGELNGGTFNLSSLSYTDTGGSCPSDWQFTIQGQTTTVSTAAVCEVGGWLGNIGVALSLLMASFIIIGGVKS